MKGRQSHYLPSGSMPFALCDGLWCRKMLDQGLGSVRFGSGADACSRQHTVRGIHFDRIAST
jgi:hypothetical protein